MSTLAEVATGAHQIAETAAAIAEVSESVASTATAAKQVADSGRSVMRYVVWTIAVLAIVGVAVAIVSRIRSQQKPESS